MVIDTVKALNTLDDNYLPIAQYHLSDTKKILLEDKERFHCRFCGKTKDKKQFKKKAHVLSRFIGNTTLFSTYECDECNENVFSPMESNFAEYMKLYHTMSRVSGYRGVPSYKSNMKERSRIDVDQGNIDIEYYEGDAPIIDIDEKDNTATIIGRRSYVPQLVFKALVKMAVSIMPEKELENIPSTLSWLQGKKIEGKLIANFRMYGGEFKLPFITALLLKRKESHKDKVPAYVFVLAYDYFVFTISIPFCTLDRCYIDDKISLTAVPSPFDGKARPAKFEWLDLSSDEKISNEECSVTIQFEKIEKKDINPKDS